MERLVCLPWCSVERTVADTETLLSSIIDAKHIPYSSANFKAGKINLCMFITA